MGAYRRILNPYWTPGWSIPWFVELGIVATGGRGRGRLLSMALLVVPCWSIATWVEIGRA